MEENSDNNNNEINQGEEDRDFKMNCRMYESKYPQVDDFVIAEVKSVEEMGAYVALKEYNDIEGMIPLGELSRRRIRSINKFIRVGRLEVVQVLRVDEEKGTDHLIIGFTEIHLRIHRSFQAKGL